MYMYIYTRTLLTYRIYVIYIIYMMYMCVHISISYIRCVYIYILSSSIYIFTHTPLLAYIPYWIRRYMYLYILKCIS